MQPHEILDGQVEMAVNDISFSLFKDKSTKSRKKYWGAIELLKFQTCCWISTVSSPNASVHDSAHTLLMGSQSTQNMGKISSFRSDDANMFCSSLHTVADKLNLLTVDVDRRCINQ